MAWESVSGEPLAVSPVDAHLLRRVLKPSGVGKLGPFYVERSRGVLE